MSEDVDVVLPPREENPVRVVLSAPSYLEEDDLAPADAFPVLTASFDLSALPGYGEMLFDCD